MEKLGGADSSAEKQLSVVDERPVYETPRILEMSEREILNSFQITQSMAGWWATM